jgi:aminoglycoside 6-adenylyltransferase
MTETVETDAVIEKLIAWGDHHDDVRAMILTSTRAVPNGKVDALSDYDVIVVLRDIQPWLVERSWIGDFGDVLVAYWDPVGINPLTDTVTIGNVVQYEGALKIDFGLWPGEALENIGRLPKLPAELDAGYRVLLDKDGLTDAIAPPTYTGYIPQRPDEATYQTLVNDFFIGVPYVAKCLLRDEILPAKWCFDYDMRYVYLLPMLEWRVQCDRDWSVSTGVNGKGLKTYLPAEIWAGLEDSFAGAEIEANWDALFRMIDLFRRVAREVASHLEYTYLEDLDRLVTEHAHRMRNGEFGLPAATSHESPAIRE